MRTVAVAPRSGRLAGQIVVATLGVALALSMTPASARAQALPERASAPELSWPDLNRNRIPDEFERDPYTAFHVVRGARPAGLIASAYPLPVRPGQPLLVALVHPEDARVLRIRVEPGSAVPRIAEAPTPKAGLTSVEFDIPHEVDGDSVRITVWMKGVTLAATAPLLTGPAFGEYVYVEELPEAILKIPPEYPEHARRWDISGVVMVQALIGRDGLVKDTKVVRSVPGLDEAAVRAVRKWKFKPALAKGEPVAVWVAIPVTFTLH